MDRYRVGVDIGGTFTDIVFLDSGGRVLTRKVSSSVEDYAQAIASGLAQVFDETSLAGADVAEVRHGTTVASNAILENKGALTGLITTRGFRDVLELRNLRMPRLYDLGWEKPAELVERYLRVEVEERINSRGEIVVPLAREAAEAAVDRLVAQGVEAIAVCLLNSFENPAHELLMREVLAERAPHLVSCISYDVLPEVKEYERTSTTVVNAYVMPTVARYLESLRRELEDASVSAPVMLMQSNGGLTTVEDAIRLPCNIIESGPAGGVVGAQALARKVGLPDVITLDMGGTTAKASLVEGGEFTRSLEYSVGGGIMQGSRLLTGSGYLIKVPAIDLAEVGAGGGSIVRIDAGGSMQCGPESAGAVPGPVCYDQGGEDPTITDANVILGYINPNHLVGGELTLNAGRGRAVFEERVARPLGLELAHAAYGAHQIAASNMIRAIRSVSSERGARPAALHHVRLRRERAAIRGHDGGGSAHEADPRAARAGALLRLRPPLRGRRAPLLADVPAGAGGIGPGRDRRRVAGARGRGPRPARARGVPARADALPAHREPALQGAALRAQRDGSARSGERSESTGPGSRGSPRPSARSTSEPTATGRGRRSRSSWSTWCWWRKVSRTRRWCPTPCTSTGPRTGAGGGGSRNAYFGPEAGWIETPVVGRSDLAGGAAGPLIVEEYDATCLVPPGARASLDDYGSIVLDL